MPPSVPSSDRGCGSAQHRKLRVPSNAVRALVRSSAPGGHKIRKIAHAQNDRSGFVPLCRPNRSTVACRDERLSHCVHREAGNTHGPNIRVYREGFWACVDPDPRVSAPFANPRTPHRPPAGAPAARTHRPSARMSTCPSCTAVATSSSTICRHVSETTWMPSAASRVFRLRSASNRAREAW